MFGWLKQKTKDVVISEAIQDMDRQLSMLKRASDDDLGLVLASATFWRLWWTANGMLPSGAISNEEVPNELAGAQFRSSLRRQIQEEKKSSPAGTIGLTVWLNTSRSLSMPELLSSGRQMWKELSRGRPFAPGYLPQFFEAACVKTPADADHEVYFFPPGLGSP
jgi:hypothetical protein